MAQKQLSAGERPLFPEGGMQCPVPHCNKDIHYGRYDRFSEHWARVHLPFSKVFQCIQCGIHFYRANEGRQHTRRAGVNHLCEVKIIANPRYRSTGGLPKPRFPTKEERETRERGKQEAQRIKEKEREDQKERDREQRRQAARNDAMDLYFMRTELELDYE